MYINSIHLQNFRNFREAKIDFLHPERNFDTLQLPRPKYPNINLLLGDNGSGKTSLLKAIAIASLGPLVDDAGLSLYRYIRQEPNKKVEDGARADISALITPHAREAGEFVKRHKNGDSDAQFLQERFLESMSNITKYGDIERLRWSLNDSPTESPWMPIFHEKEDAYFLVGYGATRWTESPERFDPGGRRSTRLIRTQRIQSLFEEGFSLAPLSNWLPEFNGSTVFNQAKDLMNRLLKGTGYTFSGEREQGEYLLIKGGMKFPIPMLSDGYRAYISWIGDLLYHLFYPYMTSSSYTDTGKATTSHLVHGTKGIVMIDEIDLHLHPSWQMRVLPTLSKALPNIQFIVTSHSPLVASSLEWTNILAMKQGREQKSTIERIHEAIHGLDADQVLVSDFFGLKSTRAESKEKRLKELTLKARHGDDDAALELIRAMSGGEEAVQ